MFDILIDAHNTNYGIIKGDQRLLYIKVGNGGDVYGNENRYLRIAKHANAAYGFTVLVASNPQECSIKDAMTIDSAFMDAQFPSICEILAFGHSKGGQMLLSYAYLNPKIKKVLSVNAPLMINLHKTKDGIAKFKGERLTALYGEKDQSARYIALLKSGLPASCSCSVIPNANHGFENMLEEFISLPERFLLRNA